MKHRRLELLLFQLVASGFLELEGERFANAPIASHYLVQGRPGYFGGIHELWTEQFNVLMQTPDSILNDEQMAKIDFAGMTQDELGAFLRGLHGMACRQDANWPHIHNSRKRNGSWTWEEGREAFRSRCARNIHGLKPRLSICRLSYRSRSTWPKRLGSPTGYGDDGEIFLRIPCLTDSTLPPHALYSRCCRSIDVGKRRRILPPLFPRAERCSSSDSSPTILEHPPTLRLA